MYRIDWKPHTTPLGRQIFRLRASGHRISASGHFSGPTIRDLPQVGWPTARANDSTGDKVPPGRQGGEALKTTVALAGWVSPTAQDGSRGGKEARPWDKGVPLSQQAVLSGWNTPQAGTPAQNGNNAAGNTDYSRSVVAALSGWATASARDWKDTPGMATEGTNPDGTMRTRLDQLPRQVALTTPHRLTASGEMLTGSDAEMTSGGQLNPEHSRWLMGFPAAWGYCGAMAMQSSRKSRRRSSNALNWPDLRAALDMLE
jgi:hypothetical protein